MNIPAPIRAAAAGVLVTLLPLLAACSDTRLDDATPAVGVTEVVVEDNRFEPRAIEVPPATEVTWQFDGRRDHNVVGDGWASDVMRSGSYARRFDEPGVYDYRCTLHRDMTGRVVVRTPA